MTAADLRDGETSTVPPDLGAGSDEAGFDDFFATHGPALVRQLYRMTGDLTVEQVAAEIGTPSGTVKARLVRGRDALAQLLSDARPPGAPDA